MILLHPSFPLLTAALIIYLFARYRPGFRFNWYIAFLATMISLGLTIYWKYQLAATFTLINNLTTSLTSPTLTWSIDPTSLPIIFILVMQVITNLVFKGEKPDFYQLAWNLLLIGLAISAASSKNLYTLAASWSSLTFVEILKAQPHKDKVDNSSTKLLGSRLLELFLILWAVVISGMGTVLGDFFSIGFKAGIFLIFASILRLRLLPKTVENSSNYSGVNSSITMQLVSCAAGFSLLTRVIWGMTQSTWEIAFIVLTGMVTILVGVLALFSVDQNSARRLRLIGFVALALVTTLLKNPSGTAILGATFILIEVFMHIFKPVKSIPFVIEVSLLFLYVTGLPFTSTFRIWDNQIGMNDLWLIPCLAGYAILLASVFMQYRFSNNNSSIKPETAGQTRRFSFLELSVIPVYILTIGYTSLPSSMTSTQWGIGSAISIITITLFLLSPKLKEIRPWLRIPQIDSLQNNFLDVAGRFSQTISKLVHLLTSLLEGDGGVLWSIVILVLFISLLTRNK